MVKEEKNEDTKEDVVETKEDVVEEVVETVKENVEETVEAVEEKKVKAVPEVNYKEKFVRLQAEFANYEKRTEKERSDLLKNANADLISKMLEVLDNFDLALKHNEDAGVAMIYDDLFRILEKQGLMLIKTDGKFYPQFHEALTKEEGDEDGIILEEFQKGYLLNGKLLRASKVKISVSKK